MKTGTGAIRKRDPSVGLFQGLQRGPLFLFCRHTLRAAAVFRGFTACICSGPRPGCGSSCSLRGAVPDGADAPWHFGHHLSAHGSVPDPRIFVFSFFSYRVFSILPRFAAIEKMPGRKKPPESHISSPGTGPASAYVNSHGKTRIRYRKDLRIFLDSFPLFCFNIFDKRE